jgi:hypothetical protein
MVVLLEFVLMILIYMSDVLTSFLIGFASIGVGINTVKQKCLSELYQTKRFYLFLRLKI